MGGKNTMSWDCHRGGRGNNCFNEKRRLKFEVFSGCFPGRINFSDVDGIVEIGRRFLMLEGKSSIEEIPAGQRILFEHLTEDPRWLVLVVVCDAESMRVSRLREFCKGMQSPRWEPCNLDDLRARISEWVRDSGKELRQ